ncbi:unnamed protein product [Vitrella brassicaformis CCMP3155]|uniref:RING-type domain-containing protein n=1 Tax=Vitrella brassicaformis (strain CCMP3155) TaxID=1169540 RepID=A0A0G4H1U8_VITBC|nr:unnamed protein product [Vitrella brassicaformis CCMP3155]|eukprot:CEM37619.1 unnamed protein product [Vitrella brassicaformis CCMP3155]
MLRMHTCQVKLLQKLQKRETALEEALKGRQSAEKKGERLSAALERYKAELHDLNHKSSIEKEAVAALKDDQQRLKDENARADNTIKSLTKERNRLATDLTSMQREKDEGVGKLQQLEKAQNGVTQEGLVNTRAVSVCEDRVRVAATEREVRAISQQAASGIDQLYRLHKACLAKLSDLEQDNTNTDTTKSSSKCAVCSEHSPSVVFSPCSHAVCGFCWAKGGRQQTTDSPPKCPKCCADIASHALVETKEG